MIRVISKPEPSDFDKKVRQPGKRFLERVPNPSNKQWKSYWLDAKDSLYEAYDGICAYCCLRIGEVDGASVDHFIPKSVQPLKAYEWTNFRLAYITPNRNKSTQSILDPFIVQNDWFYLEIPSLIVYANDALAAEVRNEIKDTIDCLGLNTNSRIKRMMLRHLQYYCSGDINWNFMMREAPFLAREIERQKLTREELSHRMGMAF